jgi:hypothetical protein
LLRECGAPQATKDDATSLLFRPLGVTPAFAVDRDPARRFAHLNGDADSLGRGQPASRRELNAPGRFVCVRDHDAIILGAP